MCPISGYFDTPFAENGDLNTIPDATQPSGSVSYNQGFPVLYSTPVTSGGFNVPRTAINQVLNDVTTAIQFQQQGNAAPFITSSMNGGSPYAYPKYAVVLSGGVVYQSIANGNTDTPPSSKWIALPLTTVRQQLMANTTWFVATTGSDSNNGLSSGSPFLTIQHAVNVIQALDMNGFTATISVADGTYTSGIIVNGPTIGGTLQITGNNSTPANCLISTTNANCITGTNGAMFNVGGFKLIAATTGYGIGALTGSTINVNGPMNYGSLAQAAMTASDHGNIFISASFTVSSSQVTVWDAERFGQIAVTSAITVTLSGSPTWSIAFATVLNMGFLIAQASSVTFSGSASGSRYSVTSNGLIETNGGGSTFFPGSSAGSASTQGQYL